MRMVFTDLHSLGGGVPVRPVANRTKINYYYKLKLLPKLLYSGDGFKVRLDRLSLTALFDRNHTRLSAAFDVVLAALVACLAALLISHGIYAELSMIAFAFVVASSQVFDKEILFD